MAGGGSERSSDMHKVTQLHLGLGPGHVCSKTHPGTGQPRAHKEQRFSLKFP